MGLHAFSTEPAHCAAYRAVLPSGLPRLHGHEERWNVPTALHEAVLADGASFPAVDHYVVSYHVAGANVRRIDDDRFDAVADARAISLQRPGSGGRFSSAGRVRYAHLYFRRSLLCEVGDGLDLGTAAELDDAFAGRQPELARHIADYVTRARARGEPATAIEMDSRGYLLALELLRRLDARGGRQPGPASALPPPRLKRVFALIDERLVQPLRLSELADAAGLSPFHFARMFRATTGQTPARYVMQRRTERAMELITGTRSGLAEIAHRTGFSSQSHMTRHLKAGFGTTPGALRRRT